MINRPPPYKATNLPIPGELGESDQAPELPDVAFFFGAGASVDANVPDTAGLLRDFVESLPSGKAAAINDLLSRLRVWADNQNPRRLLDIELVLETLQHAADWKSDPLAAFIPGEIAEQSIIQLEDMLRSLRDFVKDRVMVKAENVRYLTPLRGFIDQYKPLNIFSANYDTAIEVFCAEHKLKYRDGFDEVWNPKVFEEPDIHVRLFKIHGSVTWYRTDRGRFVKIPTMVQGSRVELFTKEQAELVMLYPAQKFEYVEPLFELTLQMKEKLAQCRTLFVVGYSFRDEHVRRLFWDIARQNSDFYVILIDPSARRIYRDRLKQYDDAELPSSLVGRVVCLPYFFGKAFPALQSIIFKAFRQMRTDVDAQSAAERQGEVVHWQTCMLSAGECGDYETLRMVLEKVAEQKYNNYQDLIKSIALALYHAIANDDREFVLYFWNQLRAEMLEPMKTMNLNVDIGSGGRFLRPNMLGGRQSPNSIIDIWSRAHSSIESRLEWTEPNLRNQALIVLLKELVECLDIWKTGNAQFVDYLRSRGTFARGTLEALLTKLSQAATVVSQAQDQREEIEHYLRLVEERFLASVFDEHEERVIKNL